MTFSQKVTKMIDIIKNARLQLIAKGETVEYDDDIPEVIEHMSSKDTQALINLISRNSEAVINVPNGTTQIGYSSFRDYYGLVSVVLPNSVVSINDEAFSNCQALMSISLGNGVRNIGYQAFYGCARLTEIALPPSILEISEYAFDSSGLLSINIPSGVTVINPNCFSNTPLRSAVIPSSVESIFSGAFANCTNLTDIYYTGTQNDWEGMVIEPNAIPAEVTIHYEYSPSNA